VAGQISGGWDAAESTAASASAEEEISATVITPRLRIVPFRIRRS
jgi:hypothetical protein